MLLRLFIGCSQVPLRPHVVMVVVVFEVPSWPNIGVKKVSAELTCHEHVRKLIFCVG